MTTINGTMLKKLRKSMKITQSQLAEAANTTERYLRDLESGRKHAPSAGIVYGIANALGVPMEELMTEEPEEE